MTAFALEPIAREAAGRALNTIAEGLAVTALSWVVLALCRVRSSKLRFAVWFQTLLMVAALPFLAKARPLGVGGNGPQWAFRGVWASALFLVWASVAGLLLLRLVISFFEIRKLQRSSEPVDVDSHPGFREVLDESMARRPVRFRVSTAVLVPTTIGFFKPAVLLPPWTLAELSQDELKVILIHELAHLKRQDDWTNLAQKVLKSLLFFHPAVHWIETRLELEREMACDELVLAHTRNPQAYARSLVSVAERSLATRLKMGKGFSLAQNALGRMRHASRRLLEILDPNRASRDPGRRPALVAVGALAVVAVLLVPYAPQVVVFEGSPKALPMTSAGLSLLAQAKAETPPKLAGRVSNAVGRKPHPMIVPTRARLTAQQRQRLVLARAAWPAPPRARTILLVQATGRDPSGALVWTLCVWRTRVEDGRYNMFEETIVMKGI